MDRALVLFTCSDYCQDATQWRIHRTSRTTRWPSDVDGVAGRQDAVVAAVE